MKTTSLKMVCFSPTGTSRTTVQTIANGLGLPGREMIDITLPEERKKQLTTSESDLILIAVPVYSGRIPGLVSEWMNTITADNTPVISVVVYGNREFEDALLEMNETLTERGCIPIAGAAFIGEHSFSASDTPIAVARPDEKDLEEAEAFGRKVLEKINSATDLKAAGPLQVPGNHPYRDGTPSGSIEMIDVSDSCTQCGLCADNCPVSAIAPEESRNIDSEKCIYCCACIKVCPANAKSMKEGMFKDIAIRLNKMCSERKEPEVFL